MFSCAKEKKTNKHLSGTWTPVSLKVTNYQNGLSYPAEANGTFTFTEDGKKTTKGSYDFSMNYSVNGNSCQLIETGTYEIRTDECYLTSSNTIQTPSRIIYINKEDLEFSIEKPETDRLLFVLKKN